jgi:hypothetical protein
VPCLVVCTVRVSAKYLSVFAGLLKVLPVALCWQVAALSHFRSQPLSVLAAAVGEGRAAVLEACASLDPVTRAEVGYHTVP